MSAKKGRGAKALAVPEDECRKGSSFDNMDTPNLSAIERASFMEGLHPIYGNPLHSTAMEEDLNVSEKGQIDKEKAVKKGIPQTLKTKRKGAEKDGENEKRRRGTRGKVKGSPGKEGETQKKKGAAQGERGELDDEGKESGPSSNLQTSNLPDPKAHSVKHFVGMKPARRSARRTSAVRSAKTQDKKRKRQSGSRKPSDPQSQEESDTGTAQQRRRKVLSSDEEVVDEDTSWKPSPKKPKVYSLGRSRKSLSNKSKSRKSSSGSASADPDKATTDKERRMRQGRRGGTELDVVLDAFLDFCDQYRESVESKAVKRSIDYFSSNVKEQLLEKITCYKELKVLKRENTKVGSLIRTKTKRLLDAKHELMRAERQVWLLQNKKAELKLRLADLRLGQDFLRDIRELNGQYLDYRHKHPKEKETYGESSLPALLLETNHIRLAEQPETRTKKSGTRK